MSHTPRVIIAGSILDCSVWTLQQKISHAVQGGMQWLHYDVMDGHYVPRITFGARLLADLKRMFSQLRFDCHFMVRLTHNQDLADYFQPFIAAGADLLTVQLDSFASDQQIHDFLRLKDQHQVQLGLAIRLEHAWSQYEPWIKHFDSITVMGVTPGAGGQAFNPHALAQITLLHQLIQQRGWATIIQIDGGMRATEAVRCYQAGARMVVMGSYLFNNQLSPATVIQHVFNQVR